MKVALLGAGKTGCEVLNILGTRNVTIFNSSSTIQSDSFHEHDVIICFLPGDIFFNYIDTLLASAKPVVVASTGFQWPEDVDSKLKSINTTWVRSHNFSLGMNLVKKMIEILSDAGKLYEQYEFNIHERHHTQKLDAPSGTALSWQGWLKNNANITYEREGDIVGEHSLELKTQYESIKISHTVTDRKIFAQGAIWTASKILTNTLSAGLLDFTDITNQELI